MLIVWAWKIWVEAILTQALNWGVGSNPSLFSLSLYLSSAYLPPSLVFPSVSASSFFFSASPSSALCLLLYRTEHFSTGRKGRKCAEKRGGRGVARKGGKKDKRTRENRSAFVLGNICILDRVSLAGSLKHAYFGTVLCTHKHWGLSRAVLGKFRLTAHTANHLDYFLSAGLRVQMFEDVCPWDMDMLICMTHVSKTRWGKWIGIDRRWGCVNFRTLPSRFFRNALLDFGRKARKSLPEKVSAINLDTTVMRCRM